MCTFVYMEAKKSKLVADNSSHVRISNKIIKRVKASKKKTKIPIGQFFEQAAIEKLSRELNPSKYD